MPNCDSDDGNLGVAIVSNTSNGDTLVMCGPCLIAWSVSTIEAAGLVVTNPNDDQPDAGPADETVAEHFGDGVGIGQLDGVPVVVVDPAPDNVPADSPAAGSTADQPAGGEGSDLVTAPAGELPDKPPF